MKKIVVLSGAGVSAESGLQTFRDSNGLWNEYKVEDVASIEGWYRDRALVLEFYNMRRRELQKVEPNDAHKIIASLEKQFDVCVVTQNVDNLHERAGSKRVIHLHGELTKVTSSLQPNNPAYIKTLSPDEYEVKMGDVAPDGSQLRPFIVWFGEPVPMIEQAICHAEQADIFVIIGTSLNVYPAAGLLNYVPDSVPVYLIDPKEVTIHSTRHVHVIREKASNGMKELKNILLNNN